jgi:hypothetical protein
VEGACGETWAAVASALSVGSRGLPGGSSLPEVLAEYRGKRNKSRLSPLTVGQILAWADAHRRRTGNWPGVLSGPIPEAPGETWRAVNMALFRGYRGLPGGDSLAQLLARRRAALDGRQKPPLTVSQILAWARAHYARTGRYPGILSGPVPEAPGENWRAIDGALREGSRGLPPGGSLPRLLERDRRGGEEAPAGSNAVSGRRGGED